MTDLEYLQEALRAHFDDPTICVVPVDKETNGGWEFVIRVSNNYNEEEVKEVAIEISNKAFRFGPSYNTDEPLEC